MFSEYEKVNKVWFNRVERAIRKMGPLSWREARLALSQGYGEWNTASNNRIIQEWVAAGKLVAVEQPDGDSKIDLPV
jgi:hypothetical protein